MTESLDLPKIIKELEDFFGIKVPDYTIEIANSREEFNKLTNRKHSETWMAGWANGNRIVAIHPDKLEQLTGGLHKSDSHPNRIKHELAHLFFSSLAKGEFKPIWLNEGLAFCLDGRGGRPPKNYESRYSAIKYFNTSDADMYIPSSFIVKTLLEKFGKIKMLNLINSLEPGLTADRFQDLFKDVYGFYFTKEDLKKII